jgi:hypothetical protein
LTFSKSPERCLVSHPIRFAPIVNDASKAGQRAARAKLFGDFSRYAVAPVHTRFDAVSFFVWDTESLDDLGMPRVVRQETTLEQAIARLV